MFIYAGGEYRKMNDGEFEEFMDSMNNRDGVFETVRVSGGKPEYLENHLERLQEGARFIGAEVPEVNCLPVVKKLAEKNLEGNGLARLRIILYIGEGGGTDFCVTLQTYQAPPRNGYHSGVQLITAMHPCCESGLAKVKCTRRSGYSRLKELSAERGYFDCMLTDRRGVITETTISSIFFVQNGQFYIPPCDCSRLRGIMESVVKEELKEMGVRVGEKEYRSKDITAGTGMFMTNSLIGVMPVRSINRTMLKNSAKEPAVARLIDKFSPHPRQFQA